MANILLVEDNPKHLADARMLLEERITRGVISRVDYASTLASAMNYLRTETYDGVMSDVFFPEDDGKPEAQHGTHVAEYVLAQGNPVVLVTSTYHHGSRTQPVCRWGRERGIELIDRGNLDNMEIDASEKNWKRAFLNLAYLMEGKRTGEIIIGEEGMTEPSVWGGDGRTFYDHRYHPEELGRTAEEMYARDPLLKTVVEKYCAGMSFKEL